MLVPINEAGKIGIVSVSDRPPHELPLNAWTAGENVRFRDGMVEKFLGHAAPFGNPTVAPYFLMPARNGTVRLWLYAGLAKVYTTDGTTHYNITRQTTSATDIDYSATVVRNWTGGALGLIPVINNGIDVPQFWQPSAPTQILQDLTNWPASTTASALRVFRRYLVALDVIKSGTRYPQMVKWSSPAPSGGVPATWDPSDETNDAGEYEIVSSSGDCLDLAPMRDQAVIYKEDSVHWMQHVGGVEIFSFPPMFDSFGALSRRCAVEYARGRHIVLALGDLIAHDGQQWDSVVSGRMRRWMFQQMDPDFYQTSFIALHPAKYEAWACFPSIGNQIPNLALVWNWRYGTCGVRELPGVAHAHAGEVFFPDTGDIWDSDSGVWDSDASSWGEAAADPAGLRMLMADAVNTRLLAADFTNQYAGANMTAFVERVGMPLPVKPDGPPDMRSRKFIKDLWPRVLGTDGQQIQVYIGGQDAVDAPVTWQDPVSFTIGTTDHIPVRLNTRLLAIRFQSNTDLEWRIPGYEIDVVPAGRF